MMRTARLVDRLNYGVVESASQPSFPNDNVVTPTPDLTILRPRPGIESAAQARLAGRLNAASVSDDERRALLSERAFLLNKKFETSLTKAESRRLEYVRWSLDRIEDARTGMQLDMLESRVGEYEDFLSEIKTLQDRISNIGRNIKS
jgi:hypothetical protein